MSGNRKNGNMFTRITAGAVPRASDEAGLLKLMESVSQYLELAKNRHPELDKDPQAQKILEEIRFNFRESYRAVAGMSDQLAEQKPRDDRTPSLFARNRSLFPVKS